MFKHLTFKLAAFVLLSVLTVFSLNRLNKTPNPTVVETAYSLPNNQSPEYSQVFAALPQPKTDIVTSVQTADARAEILRQYLNRFGSPLEPYSDLIVQQADQYDFDYRWLVAIAMQESTLCKFIPENSYNCWGWGIYGDKITRFDSFEDAIRRISPQFKKIFLKDMHFKDPLKVMRTYTPPSDGSWARGVGISLEDLQ